MKLKWIVLSVSGVFAMPSSGCDLCAIYSMAQARGQIGKGWFSSVAVQFTHQGTLTDANVRQPNDERQRLDSATTQIVAGYNFSDHLGVQLNVPIIHRSYRRTTDTFGVIESASVSGPGDLSLAANFSPYRRQYSEGIFRWTVLGGLKLPTGSTSRLHEEVDELTAPPIVPPNVESAIHGHDLTLGSGSVDGVFGTGMFASWKHVYVAGSMQYAWRGWGDFGYRFANDLTWSGGPGFFLVMNEDLMTLTLQSVVSGEHKGLDRFNGARSADSGVTFVYAGPQVSFSWKERLTADVGVDVPISRSATSLQAVPDYRMRAALNWRF
jgi:hypothetical protein